MSSLGTSRHFAGRANRVLVREASAHRRRRLIACDRNEEEECIGKGKARAPYEFGCKVSIATPATAPKGGQFVLHMPRPCTAIPMTAIRSVLSSPISKSSQELLPAASMATRAIAATTIRSVQGLDLGPGPPGHQTHPPRDAPSRRRRTRDRPSQGEATRLKTEQEMSERRSARVGFNYPRATLQTTEN